MARILKKTKETIRLRDLMMTPISAAKQNLRNSYKAYTKYKKESIVKQKTWLLELAESRAQQELTHKPAER